MDQEEFLMKERGTLEAYFSCLGHFNFDKAKEIVEKERDALLKSSAYYLCSGVLTSLSQLAVAEKLYMSLQYLVPKSFLRKDTSLKALYEQLRSEFGRMKEQAPFPVPRSPSSASSSPVPSPSGASPVAGSQHGGSSVPSQSAPMHVVDSFLSHLCGQLHSYVLARSRAVDFYDRLYAASAGKTMPFKELSATLSEIIAQNQKLFHHPLLTPIKSSFSLELEVLHHLLEAQAIMSQWQFLQSLIHLHSAQAKLGEWNAIGVGADPRRQSLLRPEKLPHLYTWLNRLNAAMVAKFTLYFNRILSKQTTHQEMKHWGSKMSVDYCQRIASFQKKSDALCVVLLFDALGVESYYERGYRHPDHGVDPPKGIDNYPAIYYYPTTYQEKQHRPNVIMIINKSAAELNAEGVVCFYDNHVGITYFLTKLDPRITLVAIYGSHKSERDTFLVGFVQDLGLRVRGHHVFSTLKPGSK